MTTPDRLYYAKNFFGTWTYINAPKPADKEGGIWVERVLKRCGHDTRMMYYGCSKPFQIQDWVFVKSGDRVSPFLNW